VLSQRSKAIIKGCTYSSSTLPKDLKEVKNFEDIKLNNGFMVLNQSSSELPIPNEAIDVIITDPPYGSNVQYAELSTIWNAWFATYKGLDSYIYKEQEAVVNRKKNFDGSKTIDDYEELLFQVYAEGARVLKENGYLVFTFNNKNIKVWIAMLKAVARAGFYLPDDGILFQDYIESYKNTAHLRFSGNIQGDFIYSFRKGKIVIDFDSDRVFSDIIDEAIDKTVTNLFRRRKTYDTPELYQKVLTSMTKDLMTYILWCNNNQIEMEDISSFSNDYLENRLKRTLVCEDGIWRKA
jgi:DNA-binding protein Fis